MCHNPRQQKNKVKVRVKIGTSKVSFKALVIALSVICAQLPFMLSASADDFKETVDKPFNENVTADSFVEEVAGSLVKPKLEKAKEMPPNFAVQATQELKQFNELNAAFPIIPPNDNNSPQEKPAFADAAKQTHIAKDKQDDLVEYAKTFKGVPYVYGGNAPNEGFDCSGFTCYVFKEFGIKLERVAADQALQGDEVKDEFIPGDLLFFSATANASQIDHVAIYIGDDSFIHAPRPGDHVRIESIDTDYYRANYILARRFIED